MSKLDESEIIKIFQRKLGNKNSEDVEIFKLKQNIIAKTDTLVQSTDIPPKMKLGEAARKSVVACVSDFAAKGVKPQYGIISINFPSNISRSKVEEAATGFRKACSEFGISILGGDTNAGKEIVFNVCLFGSAEKIVPRNGSESKDLIFATGPFGYTGAGLSILLYKKKGKREFVAKAIKAVTHPKPRVDFGVKNKRYFTSSMDSSDGLSTTLNEMAKQSKKKFVINNSPHKKDLGEFAKSNQDNLVFHGGEEYEFVFTINPKHKKTILKNAKSLRTPIIEIGYVTTGKGVILQRDNKDIPLKDKGWKHFR
ncbi:thiamine-phosphate kinase [Nitrosopumilus maritimus]|uniref:Thiamine-monophosphate kinase n=1 Tax=Nitrosopumilus maritimus (strain SCM1) TaxID=436308 RepID=THIL_NITMS|nr:thiamine-phosphate kinase [Nitrosopumilus maritimus]A9A3T2.1 RecName: Full=Thiamine-monophosphate kinase; Short=TMP kinase; Short=Thiamine-phosphate kinase [Nitrosopumilus maritimus SCM1]ABX13344.1 thiamine-monophosphate kinase [Nitrosopumilus maritimus SCM1]